LATGFGDESLQLPSVRATNAHTATATATSTFRLENMSPPADTAPDQSLIGSREHGACRKDRPEAKPCEAVR
jgi:hypothetical protein